MSHVLGEAIGLTGPSKRSSELADGVGPGPLPGIWDDWLGVLKAVLDQSPSPIFLMRADFTVPLMNAAASSNCSGIGLICVSRAAWCFRPPGGQARFASRLRQFSGTAFSSCAVAAEGSELSEAYVFFVSSLSSDLVRDSAGLSGLYKITVRVRGRGFEVSPKQLAAAFSLTPAEAGLASFLARGLSLQDYADREGIKISTARWHLKNIYDRTQTHSQQALVAAIALLFG